MQTPLRLWHAIECPFSMRVRLVLHEKGLGYRSHVVAVDDVGDEVASRNPMGSVPVLEHGDCAIYQTGIIAEYLEERFPQPALFPKSPAARARARLLMNWADNRLVEPVHNLEEAHFQRGLEGEPTREERLQDDLERVQTCMRKIGEALGDGEWVMGEFGIVDLFLAPFVVELDTIGVRRDAIPARAAEWIDRLRDRPCVAEATRHRATSLQRQAANQ
jgi:glutathione S-transferase